MVSDPVPCPSPPLIGTNPQIMLRSASMVSEPVPSHSPPRSGANLRPLSASRIPVTQIFTARRAGNSPWSPRRATGARGLDSRSFRPPPVSARLTPLGMRESGLSDLPTSTAFVQPRQEVHPRRVTSSDLEIRSGQSLTTVPTELSTAAAFVSPWQQEEIHAGQSLTTRPNELPMAAAFVAPWQQQGMPTEEVLPSIGPFTERTVHVDSHQDRKAAEARLSQQLRALEERHLQRIAALETTQAQTQRALDELLVQRITALESTGAPEQRHHELLEAAVSTIRRFEKMTRGMEEAQAQQTGTAMALAESLERSFAWDAADMTAALTAAQARIQALQEAQEHTMGRLESLSLDVQELRAGQNHHGEAWQRLEDLARGVVQSQDTVAKGPAAHRAFHALQEAQLSSPGMIESLRRVMQEVHAQQREAGERSEKLARGLDAARGELQALWGAPGKLRNVGSSAQSMQEVQAQCAEAEAEEQAGAAPGCESLTRSVQAQAQRTEAERTGELGCGLGERAERVEPQAQRGPHDSARLEQNVLQFLLLQGVTLEGLIAAEAGLCKRVDSLEERIGQGTALQRAGTAAHNDWVLGKVSLQPYFVSNLSEGLVPPAASAAG